MKDANTFKSKNSANNFISKYKIDAFIWLPYHNTEQNKNYIVQKVSQHNPDVVYYDCVRDYNVIKNDAEFLIKKGIHQTTYTKSVAELIAYNMNKELIKSIEEINKISQKKATDLFNM